MKEVYILRVIFQGQTDGRKNRPRYDIIHPITQKPCSKPSTGWRWEEERTLRALAENPPRIHFGPDEKTIPCRKSYLSEVNEEPFSSVFYKDGRAATLEVEQILGRRSFSFPKDTEVLADLIDLVCGEDDLILDSFAGSGTTAHAVLRLNNRDNGGRRFILVEMDKDICQNITRERLSKVMNGYLAQKRSGKQEWIEGYGGSFCFYEIGETLLDDQHQIREEITFSDLARYIFFTETKQPLPQSSNGQTPFLGSANGVGVYLLHDGILGSGANVLTRSVLNTLPRHDGSKVIYGEGCLLSPAWLKREGITFRQIPYDVRLV